MAPKKGTKKGTLLHTNLAHTKPMSESLLLAIPTPTIGSHQNAPPRPATYRAQNWAQPPTKKAQFLLPLLNPAGCAGPP